MELHLQISLQEQASTVIGCSTCLACQSHRHMGEGLNVTAKGTKELASGRRLHRMVAVAQLWYKCRVVPAL